MSRTSLHMPRHTRAVWLRPATGTRLFPYPFPPNVPPYIPHYKRCPKAHRLRLRSDQSLFPPVRATGYGRFPDKKLACPFQGPMPSARCTHPAHPPSPSSGGAHEHSVMSPPWAIAPPPDSPGLDLAGESEQSDNLRLKTNAPFRDSTVVTIGELRSTNAGHGSTLPSLRVVGHFWWSRLPHTEIPSRLLHVPSEAWGCRKAGFDVEHPLSRTTPIGTGVAVFLRNRPGPSIPSPFLPLVPFPCRGDRPVALGWGSPLVPFPSLLLVHFPTRDDRPVAQGVDAPSGASTPLPRPKKGTAH